MRPFDVVVAADKARPRWASVASTAVGLVFKMFVILLTLWMVPLAIGLRRLNKDLSTACADASCLNLDNLDNLTNLTDALNKVDPDDVTDALTITRRRRRRWRRWRLLLLMFSGLGDGRAASPRRTGDARRLLAARRR